MTLTGHDIARPAQRSGCNMARLVLALVVVRRRRLRLECAAHIHRIVADGHAANRHTAWPRACDPAGRPAYPCQQQVRTLLRIGGSNRLRRNTATADDRRVSGQQNESAVAAGPDDAHPCRLCCLQLRRAPVSGVRLVARIERAQRCPVSALYCPVLTTAPLDRRCRRTRCSSRSGAIWPSASPIPPQGCADSRCACYGPRPVWRCRPDCKSRPRGGGSGLQPRFGCVDLRCCCCRECKSLPQLGPRLAARTG